MIPRKRHTRRHTPAITAAHAHALLAQDAVALVAVVRAVALAVAQQLYVYTPRVVVTTELICRAFITFAGKSTLMIIVIPKRHGKLLQ